MPHYTDYFANPRGQVDRARLRRSFALDLIESSSQVFKSKKAVQERTIRLVVATDAACEGLNLQTLGTLINIDLPWNSLRLEQRIGRIKRFGQRRDRVDMLNLVYHGSDKPTVDEKVYEKLSSRMKDRYDIFGTLPDVIEDDWIDDEEKFDEKLREFTAKRLRANAFDMRYAADVDPKRRKMGIVRARVGAARCR